MALIDSNNLGTVIMRSAGSDPGFKLYNAAGNELTADKADAAAANANDHYRLLPPPAPPPPAGPALPAAPAPPPPRSPTCHHDMVNDAPTGGLKADFTPLGTDAVFLPFKANIIASAVLPTGGPNAPSYFFTAELSGCSIFVDADAAAGCVIVYHANGRDRCATGAQIQANWQVEWVPTPHTNYMDPLYQTAHASYLPTYAGLALRGTLTKATYGAVIRQEIARKAGQGRLRPTMLWGTNVFGFRNGAVWSFYYQTYGGMEEYDRPWYAYKRWPTPKRFQQNKEVRNRGFGPGGLPNPAGPPVLTILDHGLFCTAP